MVLRAYHSLGLFTCIKIMAPRLAAGSVQYPVDKVLRRP